MKNLLIFMMLISFGILNIQSQNTKKESTIFLTGASFASSNNGWFELGCKKLDAVPINKAIPGSAISDAANKMAEGKLYTKEELEDIDVFLIMHVHNEDVASKLGLKESYNDYKIPFDRSNYAAAYDYVIKHYVADCYNLKFDKNSKYYNTPSGKPVVIVFCTHWHDARTIYNSAIRRLSERWGFPVIEFDKNVGFSKNQLHPVAEVQWSILYAHNNEMVDGVEYGWHPYEGEDKYIQQRMAAIFIDQMKKILLLK